MQDIIKKRTILLVDDNIINLKLLSKILSNDYDIITATNGKEAIKILKSHLSISTICAILLDIDMPIMNGYEVIQILRADKDFMSIPIIVASGADNDIYGNIEEKALSLGANDFVSKPYKTNVLKKRISNAIYLNDATHYVNIIRNDELTGVFSKDYFYVKAESILKQNSDNKFEMICCDIEKFKLVNDLYGTNVGNQLLKYLADMLKKAVQNLGICGRIGPDVFSILLLHSNINYDEIFEKANTYLNQFYIDLKLELKFGIYKIDDITQPVYLMCDRAKLAINSIKGKYTETYKYYDTQIREKLIEEQFIVSNMKKAIDNREFEVYFQPKYEIKSSKIVGAEALVRWNNPEKGFMSPGSFIPLFEKNGFITELDKFVWEECFKVIKNWMDNKSMVVPISMNVSRTDLFNPNIKNIFLELLKKYNVKPQNIHLEITESAYTENSSYLIEVIKSLKSIGFKIDMDDFGTGYSSLNMLADIPIDVLKLDMGFLQNNEHENSRSVLSFIISLAEWMNLSIIAEGAETKEQINLLRSLGCNYVQGYYFSKPLPYSNFEKLLFEQYSYENSHSIKNKKTNHITIPSILLINEDKDIKHTFDKIFEGVYYNFMVDYNSNIHEIISENHNYIETILVVFDEKLSDNRIKEIVFESKQFNIPVLVALPNKDHVERAIKLGVNDFITKPFRKLSTLNRINLIVKNAKFSEETIEREIGQAISEMKKRAEQDSLTKLLNRSEFEAQVKSQLLLCNPDTSYFIMLDIDNFKGINDSFGHNIGDNALLALADYLRKLFSDNDIIGRMGGDEFSVFVNDCKSITEVKNVIDLLCHSFLIHFENLKISCSAGICAVKNSNIDFISLYENADTALLYAKRNGKSQYCFYKNGMDIPINYSIQQNATRLLDNTTDAMFISDSATNEIIFINDTACKILNKSKKECINSKCYQMFWQRKSACDRCTSIGKCNNCFYEEDTLMTDGKTPIHIKAKTENWNGRSVKIHYLIV